MHLGGEAQVSPSPLTQNPEPQPQHNPEDNREEELLAGANCFQNSGQELFVTLDMDHHIETWPLYSPIVRMWVRRMMYLKNQDIPTDSKIKNLLNTAAALADEQREVHVRLAGHGEAIYLDLGNPEWQQIEITRRGWSIISSQESPGKVYPAPWVIASTLPRTWRFSGTPSGMPQPQPA